MNEKRGCVGPRGYAQAMAGGESLFDEFQCPNSKEDWHEQVIALRVDIRRTPSLFVATLMETEIELILEVFEHKNRRVSGG